MYTENDVNKFLRTLNEHYSSSSNFFVKSLEKFFQKARFEYKLYERVKKEVGKYLSTDFNLVNIFQPDENKISDLIANLLNPQGKHGQGEKFLILFLEHLLKKFGEKK